MNPLTENWYIRDVEIPSRIVLAPAPATGSSGVASSTGVGILVTLVGAVAAFVTGIAMLREPARKPPRRT